MAPYINTATFQPRAGHLFQIFHAAGTQACLGVWSWAWTNFSVFCTRMSFCILPSLLLSQNPPAKKNPLKGKGTLVLLTYRQKNKRFTEVLHYLQQNKVNIIECVGYLGSCGHVGKKNKIKTSKMEKDACSDWRQKKPLGFKLSSPRTLRRYNTRKTPNTRLNLPQHL